MVEGWARGDYGDLPLPGFLQDKPRVAAWHALYWEAYWDLSSDRAGMGDGRILWSACHLWARSRGLSRRQEADLCYYIRAMDTEFMDWNAKKRGS